MMTIGEFSVNVEPVEMTAPVSDVAPVEVVPLHVGGVGTMARLYALIAASRVTTAASTVA